MIFQPVYKLGFILHTFNTDLEAVKNSLAEFGEGLEISEVADPGQKGNNFRINLNTQDPTLVFDVCSQFGRIRSIKVEEEGRK